MAELRSQLFLAAQICTMLVNIHRYDTDICKAVKTVCMSSFGLNIFVFTTILVAAAALTINHDIITPDSIQTDDYFTTICRYIPV